jgi:Cu+-exporting ATPase
VEIPRATISSKLESESGKEVLMAIDPVCGMDVDEKNAPDKSDYQGETVYFCSTDCKRRFDSNPDEFVRKTA